MHGDIATVLPPRRMELGLIPATTGSWSMGVARKQPVLVRRQLFIGTSMSHVCALGHHEAAQCSTGAYTDARAVVRSTLVLAPPGGAG